MPTPNSARPRSETRHIPTLSLRAAFQPATFNAEKRTVELVWTTGAKGKRRGWDGDYLEELEVTADAVRLERLNNGAPLMNSHRHYGGLEAVIGVVERAWIANGEGRALVRFSEREEADEIMRDVRAGILQNFSVGYDVHRYERIRSVGADGKPDGGLDTYRAVDWEPMELSIVAIPFDDGAKVRGGELPDTHPCTITTRGTAARKTRGRLMPTKRTRRNIDDQTDDELNVGDDGTSTDGLGDDQPAPHHFSRAGRAIRTERARAAAITDLCIRANLGDGFAAQLIRDGIPLTEAREAIVDEMAHEQQRTQGRTRSSHALEVGSPTRSGGSYDEPDFLIRAVGEGLFARLHADHKPSDAARPFVHRSLVELARECLHIRGVSTRLMSASRVIERALGGVHGTSDFASALGNAVERELLRAFDMAEPGVLRAGRKVTASDFRARHRIKMSEISRLEKVNEHGEFKRGTIFDSAESWKLETYGRIFGLTRQAIVNDDVGAFADIPAKMGREAREFEAQHVVDLLVSAAGAGPTMSDSVALFHASHLNLAASGSALSVTSLGAARAAMRLQKGLTGRLAPFSPKYLVVPANLETSAEKLLTTIEATKTADVNPFGGKLDLIIEPRLDAASQLRWYLAADPARYDGYEFAHLDGADGPVADTRVGFDVDGVEWKVRLDFGAGFVEHRSFYCNPGAEEEAEED